MWKRFFAISFTVGVNGPNLFELKIRNLALKSADGLYVQTVQCW